MSEASDLYIKCILTIIAIGLWANVVIYMFHSPPTQVQSSLGTTGARTGSW
jgi:hypothetical protein